MSLTMQRLAIGCVCAALGAAACADGSTNPVSPSATAAPSSLAAAFPRSGELHVTKTCPPSTYAGAAGDFCTVTSSNVPEIEVGSRVIYNQAADFNTLTLDSDVVIDIPGPGNNTAADVARIWRDVLPAGTSWEGIRRESGLPGRNLQPTD